MHLRYRDMDLGVYVDMDEVRYGRAEMWCLSVWLFSYAVLFLFLSYPFIHSFIWNADRSGLYNDSTLFPYTSGTEV